MPSCSLCVRLNKRCEYPHFPRGEPSSTSNVAGRLQHLEDLNVDRVAAEKGLVSKSPAASDLGSFPVPVNDFPSAFFLDPDFFSPVASNDLSFGGSPWITETASAHLGPDRRAVCDRYFATVHRWLPMVNKKRSLRALTNPPWDYDGCEVLFLLSMKLSSEPRGEALSDAVRSSLYLTTKRLLLFAEEIGLVSLRLIQAIVLLAVYELGHAIYPSAYLTIGRAARLGALMGMHDRKNTQQLFKAAETLTLREEQRRTWWAVFVLDRFANIGTNGLSLAVPEPHSAALLPSNDDDWEDGRVVHNESLYTTAFYSASTVSTFARTCQAAHILGKVLQHKDNRKKSDEPLQLFQEAEHLHHAICALQFSLEATREDSVGASISSCANTLPYHTSIMSALALCCSAHLLLYNQYGCNEPDVPSGHERFAMETKMQHVALDGIKTIALQAVPSIAAAVVEDGATPLIAYCLYHAATECAWFIQEDDTPEMHSALAEITRGLRRLGKSWSVAGG